MSSVLKVNEIQHTGGTTALTIDSSGVISQPAKPMFLATGADNVSLPNDTWTRVQYNTEEFDVGGYYDNSTNYRFTPLVAGKYMITARAYITWGSAATENIRIAIYKNGSEHRMNNRYAGSTTLYGTVQINSLVEFNGSTDYVEIYVRQNTSSDAVYYTGTYYGEFSGYLIG